MNSYEEKRQNRIDRFNELSEKNYKESSETYDKAHNMAQAIPFGQPILVGHHSEKRDRNYRSKVETNFKKSFELQKKAKYYEEKAKAAANNTAISTDDPLAIEKLKEKLVSLKSVQETMKKANKIIKSKKKGYSIDQKKIDLIAIGIPEKSIDKVFEEDFCGRVGFASYQLSNNNALIRNTKKRIEELETRSLEETTETCIDGISIVDNVEDNRTQIFFDGKPDTETRKKLKGNGL